MNILENASSNVSSDRFQIHRPSTIVLSGVFGRRTVSSASGTIDINAELFS